MTELINCDCMDLMRNYSENYFELAIVDPPYGIGMDGCEYKNTPSGEKSIKNYTTGLKTVKKGWDKKPSPNYFFELERVSENQIIWGGNFFTKTIQEKSGWIVWDKKQPEKNTFSSAELAYTSFNNIIKTFRMYPTHVTQGKKIHPTQKPVKLYRWLLENYAKPGDKILDTHLGSGSIAIACHYMGFDLTACEIDKDYYDDAMKRIKEETAQLSML